MKLDKDVISKLYFEQYFVDELNFTLNKGVNPDEEFDIDLQVDREIVIDTYGKMALLTLNMKIFDNCIKQGYPFSIAMKVTGVFSFSSELNENQIKELIEVNGTSIMFPYLRALASNVTSNAGIPSFILPTINIRKLIEKA